MRADDYFDFDGRRGEVFFHLFLSFLRALFFFFYLLSLLRWFTKSAANGGLLYSESKAELELGAFLFSTRTNSTEHTKNKGYPAAAFST